MPEPTPTTSSAITPTPPPPQWSELERRLGNFYDVKGAKAAGLSPYEVMAEGNAIADEWNKKVGEVYNVKGAWDAGLNLPEIFDEAKSASDDIQYGTIKPAEPPSTWSNIKNAWRAAGGQNELSRLQTRKQGLGGKILSTLMTPVRMAGEGALGALNASEGATTEIGKTAASGLGRIAPQGGPKIPVPVDVGLKGEFPYVKVKTTPAEIGETGAALGGLATAEGINPVNWLGPGAGNLARTSSYGAKKAALKAYKEGQKASLLGRMLNPKPGALYHQFDPRGVADAAQGLAALGRGVVSPIKEFMKGAKEGATGGHLKALAGAFKKSPKEIEEAISVFKKEPKTLEELGKETRVQQIAEIKGKERALGGEAANIAEREKRRAIELLKINDKMSEKEAAKAVEDNIEEAQKAMEKAKSTRTPGEIKLMKPWEHIEAEAAVKKTSPIDDIAEQGDLMADAARVNKLTDLKTSTAKEIFTTGRKGEPAALRNESRTMKKVWGEKGSGIINSVKSLIGFLADPSSVIPKIAYEAGRVFDRYNETRAIFQKAVSEAITPLDKFERTGVAILLDTKPKDWGPLTQLTNNPKILEAYKKLRYTLDKLADVEGLRRKERIGDYFPHFFKHEKQWKRAKSILDVESNTMAKRAQLGNWLPRGTADETGKLAAQIKKNTALGDVFDLEGVLNIRINAGLRKAYFNPMAKIWEPEIGRLSYGAQTYANAYVNKLMGRPGKLWKKIDETLSKMKIRGKTYSIHDLNRWQLAVTMSYYRGLLGLALDTAFKNLGQIQNTVAELGFRNTGRGLGRLFGEMFLSPADRKAFKLSGVMEEYETIVTGMSDMLNRGKTLKAFDRILFSPMRFSEYINRGTAFHAGLAEGLKRGKSGKNLVNFAKHMVDKAQFRYGVTNTSPYLQNPFGKLWYQFGSYPMKEAEFINEILKDPDKRKIYRMILFHGMVYGGSKATGAELMDAMGYTQVTIPGTGNKDTGEKSKYIMLPTGIFPHLGIYTAPALRTVKSAREAIKELAYKGRPEGAAQDLINNIANTLPGRRYLEKVYEIQQKLSSGVDNKVPKFQEHVVSIMRGKGLKKRKIGGKGSKPYIAYDAAKEAFGIRRRGRKF